MDNDKLAQSLFMKDFTLNEISFNVRMKKLNENSLISENLIDGDINYLDEWIDELKKAYENRGPITVSNMNGLGKYETIIVDASNLEYDDLYIVQIAKLNAFKKICHELLNKKALEKEVSEDEVNEIMAGIYEKTGIENPNDKKPEVSNEEIDKIMKELYQKVDREKQVDDIMNDIYKKIDNEKENNQEGKINAYELMYNEVYDIIRGMELIINNDGVNLEDNYSNIIEWSKNSVYVLEKVKSDLENDYKNGNKLHLSFFKAGGGILVQTVDNKEEFYNKQVDYLNQLIEKCKDLENSLIPIVQKQEENKNGESQDKKSEETTISNKYVLFDIVNKLINSNNINEIEKIFKNNSSADFWSVVSEKINSKEINEEDFHNIANYFSDNYEKHALIDDKVFLNDNYKELISKYPFEETDELDDTSELINASDIVDSLIEAIKSGDQEKVNQLINTCRPNELWNEILKRLDNKELSEEDYQSLMSGIDKMVSEDNKAIIKGLGRVGYRKLTEKYPVKEVNKDDSKEIVKVEDTDKEIMKPTKKHVKSRKKKKSLIQKFKDLKTWQKALVVAGGIAAVALVGVGVYHLVPGAMAAISGFLGHNQPVDNAAINHAVGGTPLDVVGDKVNDIVNNVKDTAVNVPTVPQPDVVASGVQAAPATVDFSSVSQGHQIFSDAYSAVSGSNPLAASEWFNNNPLAVFNTATNEFLNLTSQQLHDPEVLKSLAGDPNNAMLFGSSMENADGFVPLTDLIGEIIKGGKIL